MIAPPPLARFFCLVWLGIMAVCAASAAAGVDHAGFDSLLRERVAAGRVDYVALKTDARLDAYLEQLAAAEISALSSRDAQLAFWINAYNAYTLKLVTTHYPVKSIRDIPHPGLKTPWDLPIAQVGGQLLSLNHIEHKILRAELKEPRVHFAVVCAAISCPPLRAEAYTAERLDAQLTDQAREFLLKQNRFDTSTRRARLSRIFEWFAVDFGGDSVSVLRALAPQTPEAVRTALLAAPERWNITYLDYNWRLNERPPVPPVPVNKPRS